MVFVPVFWNVKRKKAQDIQQLPAGRKPRIAPKQIVPKPESYIFVAIGDLVRAFQLSAVGYPVWHESPLVRVPVKRVREIEVGGVLSRSALTVIFGSQVLKAEYGIMGSDNELIEFVLHGQPLRAIMEYAKGKAILTIQEAFYILILIDELDSEASY
ncbi:MAG: hypothetical protein HYY67_01780 [Thaumarchaeota archaeon]|nr:hypothetical protein [Nitrososphaerota archaeon]